MGDWRSYPPKISTVEMVKFSERNQWLKSSFGIPRWWRKNVKNNSFEKSYRRKPWLKIHTERPIDRMKTTFCNKNLFQQLGIFYNCLHCKNRFYIFCDFLVNLGPSFDCNFEFLLKNSAAEAVSAPPIIPCPVSLCTKPCNSRSSTSPWVVIKADPDAGQALSRLGRLRVETFGPVAIPLSQAIGKKLSLAFLMFAPWFIFFAYVLRFKKLEISCVIKFFWLSCEYYWYRTQFIAGSAFKIRTIWFDFETAETIGKNCIDPPLRTPSDSLFGLNPIYTSLVRLMPPLLIFSGLKPPPLNFEGRLKWRWREIFLW